ncbi:SNF2 N-terminal domain family protein [Leishmania donovani]|uniref:SNF2 N-terminal domain family protein n=1 Tax=Leishmania donovani TaxID=5661 RepID=A0A504XRI6_LEIDO|nr:SNF2 N-terminal domain family protein [Leishmania donovani]
MLTRRQARLLGLTSAEDGGASGSSTSSAAQSPTGVAASGLPRVSGYSIACEAISATSAKPSDPRPFIRRLSATATSSFSASTAARGYRTNSFFEPSSSASKVSLHANGDSGGCGGGGRARLEARYTDALLSKAQAAIDYWAATSTTAGPSIRFTKDLTSPWRALYASSAKSAVHVTDSFGATAKSAEGSSLAGCSARLTAAQLRVRWRGVTRNCSSPRASAKSINDAHTAQLSIAACPASTPPSTELTVEAQGGIVTSGGDSTGVAQQTNRALAPLNVVSRRSLALFTSPFYADVAAPTLSASAAALGATEAGALLPVMHQIPTQRAATTVLALHQRKEGVCAQRQRRICRGVRNQVCMKAHEARMRLLFGLSGTDSRAATTARSAPSKTALGGDHIAAGEETYLQSLNPSKSDEETKVLRVVALERELRTFRPVLIIAPLSTLPHWAGELQFFSRRHTAAAVSPCPGGVDAAERFTVYVLNGPRSERESRMGEFLAHVERLTQRPPTPGGASRATPATPVVVIPHDMLTKPPSGALRQTSRVDWHVVAIDETQRIKCARSVLFKKVCELHSVSRLVLTGTPLQKNTMELFSLLRFLAPNTFVPSELFEQLDSALLAASRSSALEGRELHNLLCRRVHRLLMPFILRRERSILKTALPPIRDYAVLKILLHPYTTQSLFYVDEEVVYTSGKLLVLDFMMRFLQRTHHKFLTLCGMRGIPYVRLDDRTTVQQREANIQGFNSSVASGNGVAEEAGGGGGDAEGDPATSRQRRHSLQHASTDTTGRPSPNADGQCDEEDGSSLPLAAPCCFLISKVAGGVGLNLQAADTVFLLDVDYNPQRDAQALSRVYRVGQTKEVRVFRLIIDHATEHDIVAIHEAKDDLGRAVVQAGCYDLHSSVHEREAALQGIFRAGALSRLSQQWATATRTSDGTQGDSGEEEREEAVPSQCASFPPIPFPRCDLNGEGGADGDAEGASETSRSSAQTPTDLHRVFSGGSGGVPATSSAPGKQVKAEMEDKGGGRLVDAADGGISVTVAGNVDPQCALLLHRRGRRHISFKLERDYSEEGGGRADRGGPAAAPAGSSKKLANPATAPLLFAATPPHLSMKAAEVNEAAAAATTRVLAPAEHLLAMCERLEEVLLRHEGERHVLEDMLRSV